MKAVLPQREETNVVNSTIALAYCLEFPDLSKRLPGAIVGFTSFVSSCGTGKGNPGRASQFPWVEEMELGVSGSQGAGE